MRRVALSVLTGVVVLVSTAVASGPGDAGNGVPQDVAQWLMSLGPIGALVYGAVLLGRVSVRGFTIRIDVSLSETDRKIANRAADAMASLARSVRENSAPADDGGGGP